MPTGRIGIKKKIRIKRLGKQRGIKLGKRKGREKNAIKNRERENNWESKEGGRV